MARPNQTRDLVIRHAKQADAKALAAMMRELHAYKGDLAVRFTLKSARQLLGVKSFITALIAELDKQPVALALLLPAFESCRAACGLYVSDFHITEHARHRGVGRAMMAACAAEAKRQGKTFLWWASKAWDVDEHHFYRTVSATEEPVMAHVLTLENFQKIAREGERHAPHIKRAKRLQIVGRNKPTK